MKISIVTPSYNQAKYLDQTIESVLSQGYPDLEYVVIDAGSKDNSVDIIQKYLHKLTYWVSEPDRGHAHGINKGFTHTSGEIMGWINSSDVYYPWTLEIVSQVFADIPEAQWITGVATHLDVGDAPQNINPQYKNLYDFLAGNYAWLQQESIFWRRSLWEASGGGLNENLKYACDFELWLRFFRQAPLYNLNTILAGFRYHDDRRGITGRNHYQEEVSEQFTRFYSLFGRKDHMRAWYVKLMGNAVGKILRKGFQKTGITGWDYHPQIVRDFKTHHWVTL